MLHGYDNEMAVVTDGVEEVGYDEEEDVMKEDACEQGRRRKRTSRRGDDTGQIDASGSVTANIDAT